MEPVTRTPQEAYDAGRIAPTSDVDADISEAMRSYLMQDLGIAPDRAESRAREEVLRKIPRSVAEALSNIGVKFSGKSVLDLGAGLGGMSEELLLRGAEVTALEPGEAWACLTERRLQRHQRPVTVLRSVGENIPLAAESVDLVISLQVLEHVSQPSKVLAEAHRVLRPGGCFYLACENYLAFREAHYQVPWFPLLPKSVGSVYLRALGRSPLFLQQAVTYTTYPGVLRAARQAGFIRLRDEQLARSLKEKGGGKWQALRAFDRLAGGGGKGLCFLDRAANAFRFGIYEIFRKPNPSEG